MEVTQVAAEGNAVYIDIEAFNGSDQEVRLIETAPFYIHLLADDTRLPFRAAKENSELVIPSGGELTASLAFVGRLRESTTTLDEHPHPGPGRPGGGSPAAAVRVHVGRRHRQGCPHAGGRSRGRRHLVHEILSNYDGRETRKEPSWTLALVATVLLLAARGSARSRR